MYGRAFKPGEVLDEILEALSDYGFSPEQVLWVGLSDGSKVTSWAEFEPIISQGNGQLRYLYRVVIGGDGWWAEYDDDNDPQWKVREVPVRQPDAAPFTDLDLADAAPRDDATGAADGGA